MATTTNYGWTTPDDTALVKDGASAIRTLGSSVDTTTKNLNPSTTLGDIEFRSSTSNVNTRLGIGSTSQVLTVTGGVPVWATPASGSMTLLSTTSLSGTTVTISSISQSYKHLYFEVFGCTSTTSNGSYRVDIGGGKGAGYYNDQAGVSGNDNPIELGQGVEPDRTSANNFWGVTIFNYASTTTYKGFTVAGSWTANSSVTKGGWVAGGIPSNTAISSLVFTQGSARSYSTGTVRIYGVN